MKIAIYARTFGAQHVGEIDVPCLPRKGDSLVISGDRYIVSAVEFHGEGALSLPRRTEDGFTDPVCDVSGVHVRVMVRPPGSTPC